MSTITISGRDFNLPIQNTIDFEVSGRYGLFSTPQSKCSGDKASYPVPTYDALRGLAESVYWKPTFLYEVIAVRVMNPIRFESMGMRVMKGDGYELMHYTCLKNPRYQVRVRMRKNYSRPDLWQDWDTRKHLAMAKRSIECGGRANPFMGVSDFRADVKPCVFGKGEGAYDSVNQIPFGLMFHDILYPDKLTDELGSKTGFTQYDMITMENGVIAFRLPDEISPIYRTPVTMAVPDKILYEKGVNFKPVEEEVLL